MNYEDRLIHTAKAGREIRAAISVLERAGIETAGIETEFSAVRVAIDTYVPEEYPPAFRIRRTAISIAEHLTESRDMIPALLHSPSSQGRVYTLTSGQREVLKERYGMTPTKEVVVEEIAVWPADGTCVRHVVIRSTEHVDKGRRHVLNSCVITDWVGFCTAVQTTEANAACLADKERIADRIETLFDRAKKLKVPHTATKGKILYRWLAEYDAIPLSDEKPRLVRAALKEILTGLGEYALADLVKVTEQDEKKTAGSERFADLLTQYL